MKDYFASFTYTNGVAFPGTEGINSSGPGTKDGTELVKIFVDDLWGHNQDLMNEAGLTPNGNSEAVGASQRTEAMKILFLPENMISGLVPSNNVTDSDHDIDISTGRAMDSTNAYVMRLTSGLTKQIDASWAAGTNAGGLFTGTVAIDTTYHIFLIRKDSDGSIDAGFDVSVTAANIPGGYTAYRRIGSIMTDGSANILAFHVTEISGGGLDIDWDIPSSDSTGNTPLVRTLVTLQVPVDVGHIAKNAIRVFGNSSVGYYWFKPTALADTTPSAADFDLFTRSPSETGGEISKEIKTDSSAQIAMRGTLSTGYDILTKGYIDSRR
jgi:hypothetical protein